MRFKRFRSQLPFKKRHLGKSLREDRWTKSLLSSFATLNLLYESLSQQAMESSDSDSDTDSDSDLEEDLEGVEMALVNCRNELERFAFEAPYLPQKYPARNRNIDSFGDGDIGHLLRFRSKEDMRRLYEVWGMPAMVKINGCRISSEEIFCFAVRRVACMNTLHSLALNEFGRDWTFWSKAFNWFVRWTKQKFAHKLDNRCLRFFEHRFPRYAAGIAGVVNEKGPCAFVPDEFRIVGFIDCNNTGVARAGAGPAAPGPNQPRRDPSGRMQEAIYQRWLRKHAVKHQTIEFPDGLAGPMFGPTSSRRNDLFCLAESDILQEMDYCQRVPYGAAGQPKPKQHSLYGDSIYPNEQHIRARWDYPDLPPHRRAENTGMNSAREAVEWSYQELKLLFPFLTWKENLKLKKNQVGNIYFFCMLLRNCYNCLYMSNASNRFNIEPPSLEEYMGEWNL